MSERIERAIAKGALAASLASTGAVIAGPVGATVGAVTGLIVGDQTTVFAIDMVAIPAFQAYMLNGTPSTIIYIKAGETLLPTGGNVTDVTEVTQAMTTGRTRKKTTKYTRFNKKFNFRAKRKSESSIAYMRARTSAVSKAWAKAKRGN